MADLKELFQDYDLADARWNELKAECDAAYRAKSDIVQSISEAIAPEKKVVRAGVELTFVVRNVDVEVVDAETGAVSTVQRPTHFIRGARKAGKKLIEV
jgi:hypothetical protein